MTHEKRTKCAKFIELTQQNIFIQAKKTLNLSLWAVWPKFYIKQKQFDKHNTEKRIFTKRLWVEKNENKKKLAVLYTTNKNKLPIFGKTIKQ